MSEKELPKPMRTKLHVAETLGDLMNDRDMERISVSDLCQASGISRTTFYQHFDNITGVGIWMWDRTMETTLYQIGIKYNVYDGHLAKFNALLENSRFFKELLKQTDYDSVMQHAGRYMTNHFIETVERHRKTPLNEFETTRMRLFVIGAKHMTRHWAAEGMVQDPVLMTEVFVDSFPSFAIPWLEPDSSYMTRGQVVCHVSADNEG